MNNHILQINNLIEKITNSRLIAIVGLSKNSGKTSVLNYLISKININKKNIGVLTTGRDGEKLDLLHKIDKPVIKLPCNIIFSTYVDEAVKNSPFIEIIKYTNINTPFGNIVIAKTHSDIETEIIGPTNVKEQIEISRIMYDAGVDTVLIDGSIDRRSIISSPYCDGVIYVAGASFSDDLNTIITEMNIEYRKSLIKKYKCTDIHFNDKFQYSMDQIIVKNKNHDINIFDSLLSNEIEFTNTISRNNDNIQEIYINTAFTDKVFKRVFRTLNKIKLKIIFLSSFNIMLNEINLNKLLNNIDVYTLYNTPILALAVNSYSDKDKPIDCCEIRENCRIKFPDLLVFDIQEIYL